MKKKIDGFYFTIESVGNKFIARLSSDLSGEGIPKYNTVLEAVGDSPNSAAYKYTNENNPINSETSRMVRGASVRYDVATGYGADRLDEAFRSLP